MDKKKARKFVEELNKLQETFNLTITSSYEEEIGYDYEGNPCVDGISSQIILVDEEGFEVSLDDLMMGISTCYYCGRNIDADSNFCNLGCEQKYKVVKNK